MDGICYDAFQPYADSFRSCSPVKRPTLDRTCKSTRVFFGFKGTLPETHIFVGIQSFLFGAFRPGAMLVLGRVKVLKIENCPKHLRLIPQVTFLFG